MGRLVSMMSPQIYGHEDAKEGLLLVAVGPAPVQKDNWYRILAKRRAIWR